MTDERDSRTCEHCGQVFHRKPRRSRASFALQRFCSPVCGHAGQGRGPRGALCRSGLHEMAGRKSCGECHRARKRGQRTSVAKPRKRKRPVPVRVESAPTWRPAGWSAQPQIRAAAS